MLKCLWVNSTNLRVCSWEICSGKGREEINAEEEEKEFEGKWGDWIPKKKRKSNIENKIILY